MPHGAGSPANLWDISTGRYVAGQGSPDLARRAAAWPEGTFAPAAYMAGYAQHAAAHSPIWNLNPMTLNASATVAQADVLRQQGVPVERVELGNEKANGCADASYFNRVAPLSARIRRLFPKARIAAIGQWHSSSTPTPPRWDECAAGLAAARRQHPGLFDDVRQGASPKGCWPAAVLSRVHQLFPPCRALL